MANPTFDLIAMDMRGEVGSSGVHRVGEGEKTLFRALRDGSMSMADWVFAMTLAGYGHTVSVGTATTVATFKTGYTAAQPEVVIDVPGGAAIIPIYILVSLEDSAGTDNEFVFLTSLTQVGAGTSTAIAATTVLNNLNGSAAAGFATRCSVYSLYSGNGTAPTGIVEFWRGVYPFADATTDPVKRWEWSFRTHPPVIVTGTGALVGYVGGTGTAPAGYIKVGYIEVPTNFLVG